MKMEKLVVDIELYRERGEEPISEINWKYIFKTFSLARFTTSGATCLAGLRVFSQPRHSRSRKEHGEMVRENWNYFWSNNFRNAYPYTKTVFSCPFVEKFSLEIETFYLPGTNIYTWITNLEWEYKHLQTADRLRMCSAWTTLRSPPGLSTWLTWWGTRTRTMWPRRWTSTQIQTFQLNILLLRTSPFMSRARLPGVLLTRTGWRPSVRDVSGSSSPPGEQSSNVVNI